MTTLRLAALAALLLSTVTGCEGASLVLDLGPNPPGTVGPLAPADDPPPSAEPPPQVWLRRVFVAPAGSDSAAGTEAAPFRTLGHAISSARAGDHILVRAGTYSEVLSISGAVAAGTAELPIRLQGEGLPKLLLPSGAGKTLLTIAKPHWQVDGFELDLRDAPEYAVAFTGTVTGSVLSGSKVHGGTSGGGISTHAGADGASIVGNEIYDFWRGSTDAHGIIVQPTSRNITIRGNLIHHNSGDSIQCLGPELYYASGTAPAKNILIEGNTMYGDREQAVDIKTCHDVTIRGNVMRDYAQSLPGGCALVVHMSAARVLIDGNQIHGVGKGIAIGGNHDGPVPTDVTVQRNRIWNVVRGTDLEGVAIRLENSERARVLNNTISNAAWAAIQLGGGVGGATSNLVVKNNLVSLPSGALAYHVGTQAPGFVSASNLFWPAPSISVALSGGGRELLGWAAWQQTGRDGRSIVADPKLSDTFTPGPAAIDQGEDLGLPFCGRAPDLGAVETGCR